MLSSRHLSANEIGQFNYKSILNNHLPLSIAIFSITMACVIIMLNIKSFMCNIALGSKDVVFGYRKTESSWFFQRVMKNLDQHHLIHSVVTLLQFPHFETPWSMLGVGRILLVSHKRNICKDWDSFVKDDNSWMSPDNAWQKPSHPRGHGDAKRRKEELHCPSLYCPSQHLYTIRTRRKTSSQLTGSNE